MKKLVTALLLLLISIAQAATITEYIQMYGPATIDNGILDLHKKEITSLDGIESIVQEPKLIRTLNLSGNRIRHIEPSQLEIFINLEHLDVSNNQLENFPALTMQHLKTLNLNHNKISSLTNLNLPQLKKLHIKNNPVKAVMHLDAPLLKKLKIQGAPIKTIMDVDIDQTQDVTIE